MSLLSLQPLPSSKEFYHSVLSNEALGNALDGVEVKAVKGGQPEPLAEVALPTGDAHFSSDNNIFQETTGFPKKDARFSKI